METLMQRLLMCSQLARTLLGRRRCATTVRQEALLKMLAQYLVLVRDLVPQFPMEHGTFQMALLRYSATR
jgi:hypothetical protein